MKHKLLHQIMFALLLVVVFMPSAFSQNTFNFVLTNDHWTTTTNSNDTYLVDIYVLSTSDPLELATMAIGLQIPDGSRNGGTITASVVAGSSQLSNTAEIPTAINTTGTTTVGGQAMRLIKIAGKGVPVGGPGTGAMLSNIAPGTRLFTLKLVTNAAAGFVIFGTNAITVIPLSQPVGYPSSLNVYLPAGGGGTNTNIWTSGTIVYNLAGPLLPVELSSFASAAQGRTVVLNWSTKTEKNSDRFEVERSLVSNTTWSTVGTVKASVLSNSAKNYSYTDTKLQSGKYQYRLKMVDNDGSFSYSSVEAAEVAVPKDFAVSQNYPNPFNPSTKIDYQVPVDAKVILEVYNIAGQKVMELVNQQMSAGYYTVDFGASKLSSGVYIYRLAASDLATGNNFSSIKKMMLLK